MPSKRVTDANKTRLTSRLTEALQIILTEQKELQIPSGLFGFNAVIETVNTRLASDTVDFEYKVPFDDDIVPNEAEITVYNLSNQTLNNFAYGDEITITSGYKDDMGIVFKGRISKVQTTSSSNAADRKTVITALDNYVENAQTRVEQSFSAQSAASDILRALLGLTGLPVEVFAPARDYTYSNTVTVSGALGEQIKKYAEVCGCGVWVNKQRIFCRALNTGDNIRFTVSADTGMLDSPEPFTSVSRAEEYEDTITGYDITMLAQHRITTAAIVDINSKNVQGALRVKSGKHTYDGTSGLTEIHAITTA